MMIMIIEMNNNVGIYHNFITAGSGASGHSASWGRANQPTSPPYESHLHSLVSNTNNLCTLFYDNKSEWLSLETNSIL